MYFKAKYILKNKLPILTGTYYSKSCTGNTEFDQNPSDNEC